MVDALCQICDCREKSESLHFRTRPDKPPIYLNLIIYFIIKLTEQFGMIFAYIINWELEK
jgi:hypothetical protein